MQSSVLFNALVGVLLFMGASVWEQRPDDLAQGGTREILVAALDAVRPQVQGSAAVEASRLCEASLADWDCPSGVSEALQRLRLTPTSRDFTQVCPAGEGCRLVGVRHLLIPGMPQRRDAAAEVRIEIISDAGGGDLSESSRDVHLTQQDGRWSVIRVD